MSNATIEKFGYPGTLIREYERWVVLLRPAQVTVGSLVLAGKEDAQRFSDLSPEAFSELRTVVSHLEDALAAAFRNDKLNYLMLMMVDPHVHYHVIPRYSAPVSLGERSLPDERWPGPPDVTTAIELDGDELAAIKDRIVAKWPS
jgi:diadenosine tetraphosphate (Ap4A) HIT family hydrolase